MASLHINKNILLTRSRNKLHFKLCGDLYWYTPRTESTRGSNHVKIMRQMNLAITIVTKYLNYEYNFTYTKQAILKAPVEEFKTREAK